MEEKVKLLNNAFMSSYICDSNQGRGRESAKQEPIGLNFQKIKVKVFKKSPTIKLTNKAQIM